MELKDYTYKRTIQVRKIQDQLTALLLRFCRISRVFLLILDLPFFCFGKKPSSAKLVSIMERIRPGDIILYADRHFPIWQLVVKIVGNSKYGHAGIYAGNGSVIEATTVYPHGSGVVLTDISEFLSGYKSICILRPPYGSDQMRNKSIDFATSQLGKPYDYKLDSNNDNTVYCTELVAKTILACGIVTPLSTFCQRRFYMPDNFLKIEKINVIYRETVSFRIEMLRHVLFAACFAVPYIFLFPGVLSPGILAIYCLGTLMMNILAGWAQYAAIRREPACGIKDKQDETPVFPKVQLISN